MQLLTKVYYNAGMSFDHLLQCPHIYFFNNVDVLLFRGEHPLKDGVFIHQISMVMDRCGAAEVNDSGDLG